MSTNNLQIKITESEYQSKLVHCSVCAIKSAVLTSIAVGLIIPAIFHPLKFIRARYEIAVPLSLLSSMSAGYFAALHKKTKCLQETEQNYTF